MTRKKHSASRENSKAEILEILRQDTDLLKVLAQERLRQLLRAEMAEAVGAEKGEQTRTG